MTSPAHFALTATLLHLSGAPAWVNVLLSWSSVYPDFADVDETSQDRWDGLYYRLHHETPWLWLWFPTGLHLFVDRLWHKRAGGWRWWGWYGEILVWILILWYWLRII
jgi:hypothetical protein